MRNFCIQVLTDVKMLFRVPVSIFFAVGFPALMLIIMMTSFGNPDIGNGLRLSDKYVLLATGMGLVPLALITLPSWIAASYESSYLLRLRYFHVPLRQVAATNGIAHAIVALLGVVVNLLVGLLLYHVRLPGAGHFGAYVLQVLVVLLALLMFGCALGFLLRQSAVAVAVGLVLMFVLYMFCGVFGNYESMPSRLRAISDWIPLKYLMIDSFEVWNRSRYFIPRLFWTSLLWAAVSGIVALLAASRGPRTQTSPQPKETYHGF